MPTSSEWLELAELLRPGRFEPRNYPALETASPHDAGAMMASFHLEDESRRLDEVRQSKAWKWMQAHHGYKAFLASARKQRERSRKERGEGTATFNAKIWLSQRYTKSFENGRRFPRLSPYYDTFGLRRDRVIAETMARVLDASDWQARHKALKEALKHVRMARSAVAFMLPPEMDAPPADLDSVSHSWLSGTGGLSDGERAAVATTRNLEREERRFEREIQAAAAMKTRNGKIRWFLNSIFSELRVGNCGTTTGLRRLVEMLDPDSSVSDDTIGRILADARKREARRDAAIDALLAKQKTESESATGPQNQAKK